MEEAKLRLHYDTYKKLPVFFLMAISPSLKETLKRDQLLLSLSAQQQQAHKTQTTANNLNAHVDCINPNHW
jgi:hypothetical protein